MFLTALQNTFSPAVRMRSIPRFIAVFLFGSHEIIANPVLCSDIENIPVEYPTLRCVKNLYGFSHLGKPTQLTCLGSLALVELIGDVLTFISFQHVRSRLAWLLFGQQSFLEIKSETLSFKSLMTASLAAICILREAMRKFAALSWLWREWVMVLCVGWRR